MGADQIPENVYLDAARADVESGLGIEPTEVNQAWRDTLVEFTARRRDFRAAVESAYRAGYGQGCCDTEVFGPSHPGNPGSAEQATP
jgi:hypothetical protein